MHPHFATVCSRMTRFSPKQLTVGHILWPVNHVTHQTTDPWPAWPVTHDPVPRGALQPGGALTTFPCKFGAQFFPLRGCTTARAYPVHSLATPMFGTHCCCSDSAWPIADTDSVLCPLDDHALLHKWTCIVLDVLNNWFLLIHVLLLMVVEDPLTNDSDHNWWKHRKTSNKRRVSNKRRSVINAGGCSSYVHVLINAAGVYSVASLGWWWGRGGRTAPGDTIQEADHPNDIIFCGLIYKEHLTLNKRRRGWGWWRDDSCKRSVNHFSEDEMTKKRSPLFCRKNRVTTLVASPAWHRP